MTTGEKIRYHRRKLKITKRRLSELTGISTNALIGYEKDLHDPSLFAAACIADVLDISLDYLAGRKDE